MTINKEGQAGHAATDRSHETLSAQEGTHLAIPDLALIMRLHVLIGAPLELGTVKGVRKRLIPIIGGSVSGPGLRGKVLSGGADWQSIHVDGTADILARYSLELDDGTIISIINPGFRRGPAEILAQIAAGEAVDPALYYFRTTPRFEVRADSPYAWLGNTIFIGTAARFLDHVCVDVFSVS